MGLKDAMTSNWCPFPDWCSKSPSATVLKLDISISSLTLADVADDFWLCSLSDSLLLHSQKAPDVEEGEDELEELLRWLPPGVFRRNWPNRFIPLCNKLPSLSSNPLKMPCSEFGDVAPLDDLDRWSEDLESFLKAVGKVLYARLAMVWLDVPFSYHILQSFRWFFGKEKRESFDPFDLVV